MSWFSYNCIWMSLMNSQPSTTYTVTYSLCSCFQLQKGHHIHVSSKTRKDSVLLSEWVKHVDKHNKIMIPSLVITLGTLKLFLQKSSLKYTLGQKIFFTEFKVQEITDCTAGLNASFYSKTGNMECHWALTFLARCW